MAVTVGEEKIDKDVQRFFRRLPGHIRSALNTAIKKSAFLIERESKKVTPVLTGRLRASIFTTINPMRATIEPKTDYAFIVHQRNPYMERGVKNAERGIQRIFEGEIKKVT